MLVGSNEGKTAEKFQLPRGTYIGAIHFRVSDLDASIRFYTDIVGFRVLERSKTSAKLEGHAEHTSVIQLTESSGAPARAPRSAGLFHVAFRYPDRKALSAALWRLLRAEHPISGAADHLVSDAIYLQDPDKNGIEFYCDQPREAWPRVLGEIAMGTEPLDLDALLELTEGSNRPFAKKEVEIGHVHLQVTDLNRSEQFYSGLLGFDVTQRSFDGALFVSAGGYHHHVGLNIWSTGRGLPADDSALGLISYSLRLGSNESFAAVKDRIAPLSGPIVHSASSQTLLVRDPDRIQVEIGI